MATELIVNASLPETRIALMEEGEIQELLIERATGKGIVGNIYKGRVTRVLPGMQAAFVDIGLEKAAFLYVDDVFVHSDIWAEDEEPEVTEEAANQNGGGRRGGKNAPRGREGGRNGGRHSERGGNENREARSNSNSGAQGNAPTADGESSDTANLDRENDDVAASLGHGAEAEGDPGSVVSDSIDADRADRELSNEDYEREAEAFVDDLDEGEDGPSESEGSDRDSEEEESEEGEDSDDSEDDRPIAMSSEDRGPVETISESRDEAGLDEPKSLDPIYIGETEDGTPIFASATAEGVSPAASPSRILIGARRGGSSERVSRRQRYRVRCRWRAKAFPTRASRRQGPFPSR